MQTRRCNGDVAPDAYLVNNEVYTMPNAVILRRGGGLSFKHQRSLRLLTADASERIRIGTFAVSGSRKFRPCAVSDATPAMRTFPREHVEVTFILISLFFISRRSEIDARLQKRWKNETEIYLTSRNVSWD